MANPPTLFEQRQLCRGSRQPGSNEDQLVLILAAYEVVELVGERMAAVFTLPVRQRCRFRLNKVSRPPTAVTSALRAL